MAAWLLGRDPAERILAASYAHSLSLKHSTDCRLVIKSDWYKRVFPGVQLVDDQDTKEKFVTTRRGMRYATSVAGSVIGEGGNFLIVDDPHSAAGAALGRPAADGHATWFDQAFATRLNDKENGVIVVVMQRLHANDLTGHLLAKGGWENLAHPGCGGGRRRSSTSGVSTLSDGDPGEPLHAKPARIVEAQSGKQKDRPRLLCLRRSVPAAPRPRRGRHPSRLDWFKRYAVPQPQTTAEIVQSWDTAFKPGELNDPSRLH